MSQSTLKRRGAPLGPPHLPAHLDDAQRSPGPAPFVAPPRSPPGLPGHAPPFSRALLPSADSVWSPLGALAVPGDAPHIGSPQWPAAVLNQASASSLPHTASQSAPENVHCAAPWFRAHQANTPSLPSHPARVTAMHSPPAHLQPWWDAEEHGRVMNGGHSAPRKLLPPEQAGSLSCDSAQLGATGSAPSNAVHFPFRVELDGKRAGWVDAEGNLVQVYKKTKRGKRGGRNSIAPGERDAARSTSGADAPAHSRSQPPLEGDRGISARDAQRLIDEKDTWEREKALLMEQLMHMELMHQDLSERAMDRESKAIEVSNLKQQLGRLQQEHVHLQEALLFGSSGAAAAVRSLPEGLGRSGDGSDGSSAETPTEGHQWHGRGEYFPSDAAPAPPRASFVANDLYDLETLRAPGK